jgi:Predicted xylanase/chitin deacetylase
MPLVVLFPLLGTGLLLAAELNLPQAGSGNPPGTTTICLLKDNKAAAVSITMDDALYASDQYFNDLFKKYNLRGTLALIVNRIDQTGSWGAFRKLLKDGKLDVGNHSLTHEKLTQLNDAKLDSEVNGARARLRKAFPGQDVICLMYPDNVSNDVVRVKVKEQHYAARGGLRGDNSLDPQDNDWFNLKTHGLTNREPGQGSGPDGAVLVSDMNAWIDSGIRNHRWVIEMLHGVKEKDPYSYAPPVSADVAEHFSYLSGKLDQVWCGTFTEVTKYIRERQNATLTQLATDGSSLALSLKDSLDDTIFNFPLTLKTQVPDDWETVRVEQSGKTQVVKAMAESGVNYIYYDAIPDQGNISISQN